MIRLFFILITLFAVERVVSKRINTYKIKKVKTLIHQINNQYKYLFKGKSEYINFYQWLILFISQAFVVYALVRYIVKKIFRYVEENYILFGKTLTIIVLILFLYFVIGYLLLSISKIYKFLYKIEDKVTKTDLLISYFIWKYWDIQAEKQKYKSKSRKDLIETEKKESQRICQGSF